MWFISYSELDEIYLFVTELNETLDKEIKLLSWIRFDFYYLYDFSYTFY
jgi:hypothetical protein